MLLSPSPERRRTSAPSLRAVVVALRENDRGPLARAIALVGDRRCALHLVVHTPRLPAPWVLFAWGQPWWASPQPVDNLADRLRASGMHVEVHRATGRPSRLAQDIAVTCGADLVT